MTGKSVLVYGGGGFGREVAWLAEQCGYTVLGFIDDDESQSGRHLNLHEVTPLSAAQRRFPAAAVVPAIGNGRARELVMNKALAAGFATLTLIHPRVERSEWIEFGEGVVICAGTILTTNIKIGRFVQINLDCTIGHDAVLEDYVTLNPGVHVSGCVRLEKGCQIGTGATIINGLDGQPLIVGAGATVGAGACVTRSIPPGVTAVGVPARPLAPKP